MTAKTHLIRFDAQHRPAILAKAKPFTLRASAKAAIGDTLELAPTKGPAFATAQCVYRARVVITREGLQRVLAPSHLADGEAIARLFDAAEQGRPEAADYCLRLAKADGFETWADLFDYHLKHGQVQGGRLHREVIGWAGLEAIAVSFDQSPAAISHALATEAATAEASAGGPLYYVKGTTIHRRATTTPQADGVRHVTLGFPVCTVSDWLDEDAAKQVALALSVFEGFDSMPTLGLLTAALKLNDVRPSNWDDAEDPAAVDAWRHLDAALAAIDPDFLTDVRTAQAQKQGAAA